MNNDEHLKDIENEAIETLDWVKQERAINDFIELTTPNNSETSFVWDAYGPEPEEVESVFGTKALGPSFFIREHIKNQPFFGKVKEIVDTAFGYMDKAEIEPALNFNAMTTEFPNNQDIHPNTFSEKHHSAQNALNKEYRDLVDNMMTHGVGFIKINSINPTEVIKPMTKLKCKTCTGNADRMSCPQVLNMQPDRCSSCGMNPLISASNYQPMPIPWPPKEDQDIWCISALGDVFETVYNIDEWNNLVNCYPTEAAATKAVNTLLQARELGNEEN